MSTSRQTMRLHRWSVVAIVFVCLAWLVRADMYEQCIGRRPRTFIATNTSCRHYIYCDGNDSFEGECTDGDYFNEEYQTCDPKELVVCRIDSSVVAANNSLTKLTTTQATPSSSPSSSALLTPATANATTHRPTAGTASSTSSTTQATSRATPASTPASSVVVNSSSAATAATRPTPTTAATVYHPNGCPIADDPNEMVLLPHPNSCTDYYFCYNGEPLTMHCSATLHFNAQSGKCDYPENSRCRVDHQTPRQQCRANIIDLYPNQHNCNYFYYCKNGYLLLQQCPVFFGWDYEKRACVAIGQAKCYSSVASLIF